jgi:hypothetical protein
VACPFSPSETPGTAHRGRPLIYQFGENAITNERAKLVKPSTAFPELFFKAAIGRCHTPSARGRTFTELTRGLSAEACYDLVYRHALDWDETGERLAFGSATGGLWLSDDGGDSWQTISTYLPPIHAMRFG